MNRKNAVIKTKWDKDFGKWRVCKRGPLGLIWWPTFITSYDPEVGVVLWLRDEEKKKIDHRTKFFTKQDIAEIKDGPVKENPKNPRPEPPTYGTIAKL